MPIPSAILQDHNQTKTTQTQHVNNPKWQEVDQLGPYKCSQGDEQIQSYLIEFLSPDYWFTWTLFPSFNFFNTIAAKLASNESI